MHYTTMDEIRREVSGFMDGFIVELLQYDDFDVNIPDYRPEIMAYTNAIELVARKLMPDQAEIFITSVYGIIFQALMKAERERKQIRHANDQLVYKQESLSNLRKEE